MEMTETSFHKEFPFDEGCMVFFLTWAPFFWTCTCPSDLAGFFCGTVHKNCGGLACAFSGTVFFFFCGVDLHGFLPGPVFFLKTTTLIISDLGLFFLELRGPCLHRGNSIVIGANIGLGVFRPWHLFF